MSDPYLAMMTDNDVALRVGECQQQVADVSKMVASDVRSKCQAYWMAQRKMAVAELYDRKKRRAM